MARTRSRKQGWITRTLKYMGISSPAVAIMMVLGYFGYSIPTNEQQLVEQINKVENNETVKKLAAKVGTVIKEKLDKLSNDAPAMTEKAKTAAAALVNDPFPPSEHHRRRHDHEKVADKVEKAYPDFGPPSIKR